MYTADTATRARELRELAKAHLHADRLAAAQSALESLTGLVPADVGAQLQLAQVLTERGHWRESCAPLRRAAEHLPRHAPLILELIELLLARGEVFAARRCLDFLGEAPTPPAPLLTAQALLRFRLVEIKPALALVERALSAGADASSDHYLHAVLLWLLGQLDASREVLADCLRRWPGHADAALLRSRVRGRESSADLRALVDRELARPMPDTSEPAQKLSRATFENVRFQLLDADGDHREAWASLERCNALMRELNPYDAAAAQAETDALLRTAPAAVAASSDTLEPTAGPTPVFIVGVPRSGSTLLERMLSGHSAVTAAGEFDAFWNALYWGADVRFDRHNLGRVLERSAEIDYLAVGARYLGQTRWRAGGAPYYIDKLPSNIGIVPFIHRALPQAVIIYIWRPAMDVCFSNLVVMFGNVSAYSYGQREVAQHYLQHRRFVDQWRTQLPGVMLDVPYTELVRSPENVLSHVLARLGLELEPACLHPEDNPAPTNTISSAQVREPIHSRANARWAAYAQELQPLREMLAEWGFAPS